MAQNSKQLAAANATQAVCKAKEATPQGKANKRKPPPRASLEPLQQAPPLLAGRPAPHKGVELVPGHAQAAQVVWLVGILDPAEMQLAIPVTQQGRGTLLVKGERNTVEGLECTQENIC